MNAIIFPASIEQCFLLSGYTEQAEPNIIRSDVEVGPAKTRRRYTKPIINIKASMVVTAAQLQVFDDFYHGPLMSGALRFLFKDPRTGVQKEFRFIDPPVYQPITAENWAVEMSIEVLP